MTNREDVARSDALRADHPDQAPEARDDGPAGPQTITGTFRRVRRGPSVRLQKPEESPAEEPAVELPPEPRPARVAMMLALAHKLQRLLDGGQVASQAEIARMLGVTPARVTQLLDLTLLAPEVQELVLDLRMKSGESILTERCLRRHITCAVWRKRPRLQGDRRHAWGRQPAPGAES